MQVLAHPSVELDFLYVLHSMDNDQSHRVGPVVDPSADRLVERPLYRVEAPNYETDLE